MKLKKNFFDTWKKNYDFKLELSPQNFHYDVLYPLYSGLLLHAFMEQVVQTEKFWAYVSVSSTFLQKKTFQGFLYIFAALKKLLQPTKSMQ